MWKLTKTMRFEASHQLVEHDGKCQRLHGHSWVVHASVRGDSLCKTGPKRGMLLDYADLGKPLKDIYERLDHTHLNDTLRQTGHTKPMYPTSENLARWVFDVVRQYLDKLDPVVRVDSVVVEETCTARCEYSEK